MLLNIRDNYYDYLQYEKFLKCSSCPSLYGQYKAKRHNVDKTKRRKRK